MIRFHYVVLLAAGLLSACSDSAPSSENSTRSDGPLMMPSTTVVDLTHAFNDQTIYWPTEEGFRRTVTAEGVTDQGYYYEAGSFASAEHGGTHIDAPIHFWEGGRTVDEIPLDQLMGSAVVIDVTQNTEANPDYRVTVEDIQAWESANRPIPDGAIVLLRTGFARYWAEPQRYLGTEATGPEAVSDLHFPGLHPDAARWLVENRSVKAVGIDTPSIDYGQSQNFQAHQILFERNVPALENLANLDEVPLHGAMVMALPMKIEGGSGAPTRVVAFVP